MKTVKLETYNKVKTELDKANLQIKELTAIAEQRAKDVDEIDGKIDECRVELNNLVREYRKVSSEGEMYRRKYFDLNEAMALMARANAREPKYFVDENVLTDKQKRC